MISTYSLELTQKRCGLLQPIFNPLSTQQGSRSPFSHSRPCNHAVPLPRGQHVSLLQNSVLGLLELLPMLFLLPLLLKLPLFPQPLLFIGLSPARRPVVHLLHWHRRLLLVLLVSNAVIGMLVFAPARLGRLLETPLLVVVLSCWGRRRRRNRGRWWWWRQGRWRWRWLVAILTTRGIIHRSWWWWWRRRLV